MAEAQYYLPHGTKWPIMGSIGLTVLVGGFAAMLNGASAASLAMALAGRPNAGVMRGLRSFHWSTNRVARSTA